MVEEKGGRVAKGEDGDPPRARLIHVHMHARATAATVTATAAAGGTASTSTATDEPQDLCLAHEGNASLPSADGERGLAGRGGGVDRVKRGAQQGGEEICAVLEKHA